MKIAIFLTGLIIDKTPTLEYIKHMFDDFARRNNLQIDYYCHFWDSNGLYPYNIDYQITKISVPWENLGSVNRAIDIFKPVDYKISQFSDIHNQFLTYYKEKFKNDNWVKDSITLIENQQFNKNLHPNFFIDNFENPHHIFDKWWHYHVFYCRFVHVVSQAFSAAESKKLIKNSNTEYAAVIKWRYDVLADLISNNDKMINAIKHCSTDSVFYTELAWEGYEWKEDLPYDINTAPIDKKISLHDGWWMTSNNVNNMLAENLLTKYSTVDDGQHIRFFKAIKSNDYQIKLTNRIQHNIIRFPESIPVDYNSKPWEYFHILYEKNFNRKKQSEFRGPIDHCDERSKYYTIKYFNFY